jgi:hypothetical protein
MPAVVPGRANASDGVAAKCPVDQPVLLLSPGQLQSGTKRLPAETGGIMCFRELRTEVLRTRLKYCTKGPP